MRFAALQQWVLRALQFPRNGRRRRLLTRL